MEELVNPMTDGPPSEPVSKANAGSFRPGDGRINRCGRPKGKRAAPGETRPLAERADQVMRLVVPSGDLAHRLTHRDSFRVVNLPADAEIVGCRFDATRDGVALILRSKQFPRIAKGSVIPEFEPRYEGLMWLRR